MISVLQCNPDVIVLKVAVRQICFQTSQIVCAEEFNHGKSFSSSRELVELRVFKTETSVEIVEKI